MSPAREAAERLLAQKETIAAAVTQWLFDEMPELHQRYRGIGPEKCLQDMRFNVEHLAAAVELERPAQFAAYTRWLDDLLRARGVSTAEVVRCLELTGVAVEQWLPEADAARVRVSLDAGLAAVGTA